MGEICGDSPHKMDRMTDMAELGTLRTKNGAKATQFAFQTRSIRAQLARELEGFV